LTTDDTDDTDAYCRHAFWCDEIREIRVIRGFGLASANAQT